MTFDEWWKLESCPLVGECVDEMVDCARCRELAASVWRAALQLGVVARSASANKRKRKPAQRRSASAVR